MPFKIGVALTVLMPGLASVLADEVLYRYEGDVVLSDETTGWIVGDPCEVTCSESLDNGHFVLSWPYAGDVAYYALRISEPPDAPPPSFWAEWQFHSNHPLGPNFYTCDARFYVLYDAISDLISMYGDACISFSGTQRVTGLDINEFHTYRFESLDARHYRFSVDGLVFVEDASSNPFDVTEIRAEGWGGCTHDQIPDMVNEWDHIRYGTISFGEQITAADPPSGPLYLAEHGGLDRFTVTFDAPNYVYIDQILVQVTGGQAPIVTQTRRPDNGDPETVEIVLDRPIPQLLNRTTRFTFNDGQAVNVVEYTYVPPTCGDNRVNQPGEECDGTDDAACPGRCLEDCTCLPDDIIPAVSTWGVLILALLLLTAAKLVYRSRRLPVA